VYEPGESATLSDVTSAKESIRADVMDCGGVLLRGFGIDDPEALEKLVESLGYNLMEDYTPADVVRSAVSKRVFTAADAPLFHFIAPHHEQSYSVKRPGIILFWCKKPPAAGTGGETPIFYTKELLGGFDAATLEALRTPLVIGRYYHSKEWKPSRYFRFLIWLSHFVVKWLALPVQNLEHHPPWQTVFHTEDRSVAEQRVRDLSSGMSLSWSPDGGAIFSAKVPSIVKHPVSGEERLTFAAPQWSFASFQACHEAMDRILPLSRWLSFRLRAAIADGLYRMFGRPEYVTVDVNGKTNPFAAKGVEAIWDQAVLFPWKRGDVLILDNVSAMHGRMPCTDRTRKILTAIADEYTV